MTEENELMQLKKADLVNIVSELTQKVNSISVALEEEKKEKAKIKRTSLIAKINSLKPEKEFKDNEAYTDDFLEGVAHGLSLKMNSTPAPPDPKVNGGVQVGGTKTDEMVFTPKGYMKKDEAQGLAIRNDKKKEEGVM